MLPAPLRRAALAAAAALALLAPLPAAAKDLVVFAAASLKNALDDVAAGFAAATGTGVAVSYAGSSALARQIEHGAPADVFFSADVPWMDHLAERGLVRAQTRADVVGNRIVLVASGAAEPMAIEPGFPLAERLGGGRLAVADVAAVPAGRYGKAALESLGVFAGVEGRLAQAENVRAALALVARGEAPFGIVYATDALAEPGVTVVGTFPADSHPPIVFPAAATAESVHPQADAFVAHLRSPEARAIFERHGFTALD